VAQAKNAEDNISILPLPRIRGLTATAILKETSDIGSIPVALTAYAITGDAERVATAGCIGYITKPIDTREFVHTVEASDTNP